MSMQEMFQSRTTMIIIIIYFRCAGRWDAASTFHLQVNLYGGTSCNDNLYGGYEIPGPCEFFQFNLGQGTTNKKWQHVSRLGFVFL